MSDQTGDLWDVTTELHHGKLVDLKARTRADVIAEYVALPATDEQLLAMAVELERENPDRWWPLVEIMRAAVEQRRRER